MNGLEKVRNKEKFKNYKDIEIITNFCPSQEGLTLSKPSWCKGDNTIKSDCRKCWEREINRGDNS